MNVERLTKLRDHLIALQEIESPEIGFNMLPWRMENAIDWRHNECGTVGCIALHALMLFTPEILKHFDAIKIEDLATDLLELTPEESIDLFVDWRFPLPSPREAASAIDRLIAGKRSWPR